jgi:ribosomal protein S5
LSKTKNKLNNAKATMKALQMLRAKVVEPIAEPIKEQVGS